MKKAYSFILLMAAVFLAGCETDNDMNLEKKVYLSFAPLANIVTRSTADNLPEEYAIKNLSVFLTEVGSNTIISSYPNIGFTPADPNPAGDTLNHKLITLPLDPATIQRKDVYVDFQMEGPSRLRATIQPIGTAEGNVRIKTITLPDSSTDGPFGRSIDYEVPSRGTVRLEIGESLMQGDPWGGDFCLEIQTTE